MVAKLSPLPERLKYLQPFRRKFASKKPEELNDYNGTDPLMKLLAKRLASMPDDDAIALVEGDLTELKSWLSRPENQSDSLQFVRDLLTRWDFEILRLVDDWKNAARRLVRKVHIKLPAEAKTTVGRSMYHPNLTVKWKGIDAHIYVWDKDTIERSSAYYQKLVPPVSVEAVTNGGASGTKIIEHVFLPPSCCRVITYYLSIPGGHVKVSTNSLGDETHVAKLLALEALLETAFKTITVS